MSGVVDISNNIMIGSDISSCIELLNKTLQTLIDKHASKLALILGMLMIFTKLSYIEGLVNMNGE